MGELSDLGPLPTPGFPVRKLFFYQRDDWEILPMKNAPHST
jgi:hypothetical protein